MNRASVLIIIFCSMIFFNCRSNQAAYKKADIQQISRSDHGYIILEFRRDDLPKQLWEKKYILVWGGISFNNIYYHDKGAFAVEGFYKIPHPVGKVLIKYMFNVKLGLHEISTKKGFFPLIPPVKELELNIEKDLVYVLRLKKNWYFQSGLCYCWRFKLPIPVYCFLSGNFIGIG